MRVRRIPIVKIKMYKLSLTDGQKNEFYSHVGVKVDHPPRVHRYMTTTTTTKERNNTDNDNAATTTTTPRSKQQRQGSCDDNHNDNNKQRHSKNNDNKTTTTTTTTTTTNTTTVYTAVDDPPRVLGIAGYCTAAVFKTVEMNAVDRQICRVWSIVSSKFTDLIRRLLHCTIAPPRFCAI